MSKPIKEWDKPEIPAWMNSIHYDSTITFKEIAPIFKRPSGAAFRKSFLLRFPDIQTSTPSRTNAVKASGFYKEKLRIRMGDIRKLVSELNNA